MKRWMMMLIALVVLSGFAAQSLAAAVFQYSLPIPEEKRTGEAFLWIPPEAAQVRGVLACKKTLMETHMVVDPRIRQACADQQLAILYMTGTPGAGGLQKLLDDLAKVSGYRELSVAPLMFVGHSAGGPAAQRWAGEMADRCFGLVQYRGGLPAGITGVPALAMVGQFDEFGGQMRDETGRENAWEGAVDGIASMRATNTASLASIVTEPGAGHFAWSNRNAVYLSLFIRKAAAARIPEWNPDATEPVKCKVVDPASGWLTSLDLRHAADIKPAPVSDYAGDKARTSWHCDRELAEANVAYHTGLAGKKDQFIKWSDPHWVDAGARYFFTKLAWVNDGQTLEMHPVYAESYPAQNGGPRWPDAGKPVGHSNAPIKIKTVGGPLVVTGANTFRVQFDNVNPAAGGAGATFMAYSEGDDEYRYTEHVGMMPRGFRSLGAGRDQVIAFEPVGNLKPGSEPVKLNATSDAGVPVEFYVAFGPAEVVDGKLAIRELPKRASYPIAVKVVAWQFGRGIEPLVKTAAPVEQTILIEKP
jgi:hypothetical protein